ncbi:GTP-binding protein [Glaciecola sp. KUL10]|uniref:CobW family GTP-binding protein n=1 Tax=Glaciecola sp. (strain KUL10) TaxID=2161813 RepID=UPI000D7852B4|nr:GTP-binding protein [Glaciecola sp. KUL10]GBL03178.1 cobalamin synthesis protein P47K [Glaciecola sp. KUL10]
MKIIKTVPTNIITGALGVGKTTFIQKVLASKPEHERWAILVNEFGEIGIDGVLLSSHLGKTIHLREIPGGCMCCASGLPMQIALNQLLAVAKPHRLLIEPTGLGHPKELIDVLSSEHYRDVIALQTTFCLSDARKLKEAKWRDHQTFKDQFQIADVVIATKSDLYEEGDSEQLSIYLTEINDNHQPVINSTDQSLTTNILDLLSRKSAFPIHRKINHLANNLAQRLRIKEETPLAQPVSEPIKKQNQGEGFYSQGWIWPASFQFDFHQLINILEKTEFVRVKGVMITNRGIFGFNAVGNELNINEFDEVLESRMEIIAESEEQARVFAEQINLLA